MKLVEAKHLLSVLDGLVLGDSLPHGAIERARRAVAREVAINEGRAERQRAFFDGQRNDCYVMRCGPLDLEEGE